MIFLFSKSIKNQIQLVNQAINASINSLNLTKQLINELERVSGSFGTSMPGVGRTVNIPGIIGTYDGENMVTEKGQKFPVPQNYASKSELVYGDTLKRIEEGGGLVFKQVQRVKRLKVPGVLVKKEGRWAAVTSEGSYKVLDRTVEHFGFKEGQEVMAVVSENNKTAPFAAIEQLKKEESGAVLPKPEEEKKKAVSEEKKPAPAPAPAPVSVPVPAAKTKEAPKKEKPKAKKETKREESAMSLSEEKPKGGSSVALKDDDLR
ncbi:hypothetical protein COT69_00035 [candidate division WWE3 bacterium CG09_land_8_20_14_0_10_39_24]|uniref:50S ribosomal protein L7/L12 n=2 Tax=Katanobacteria TaxID=422282 RepID=A0A2G9XCB1_UNCKA|nr:MAG: hypothetical protein AUJ94_02145 [bacterium CG2_30_40_12]OJI09714.1 MAG: hypothetical protein BK003_00035 [bacterium CG09_39_24]PIP04620.1 MAG: hypothetical protein COX53_01235 [candidate division WWE3 bacterium CG23_combo_of_CG06-09_8_20_14_all_40_14]PIS13186.1 MAG: hypothetical protein COT69_00035 [candidate division WWE3 bacterium CG09_land_8_20_14_0_10_39_24]PJE52028.1 MAG: hypothetical protein COV27_00725 [candidate division WWE3 bacterium CG10_big_fil_rev_8_21_14_0_10_39_14]